jgi:hypothetical protein
MLKAPKNITLPPGLQRACLCLATGGRAADPASRLRDFSQRRRADAGVWCPRGLACCLPSCRPPGLPSRHPPSRPPSLRPPGVPEAPVGLLPPVPAVRPSRRPSACCLPFPPSVGLLPPVPAGLQNRVDWVYPNPNPKLRVPAISGSNISGLISGIIFHYPKLRVPEFLDPKFSGNPNAHPYHHRIHSTSTITTGVVTTTVEALPHIDSCSTRTQRRTMDDRNQNHRTTTEHRSSNCEAKSILCTPKSKW